MSQNLRDQLLGLGFKPSPAKAKAAPAKKKAKPQANAKRPGGKPKSQSSAEMDLAKAYAIRAQTEKREADDAKRQKEEQAALKRQALNALMQFAEGKGIATDGGEIARHFEYGGKIKRIYVKPEQLQSLNAGELGVIQIKGRMILMTRADAEEAARIFPASLALLVDPDAPAADDPYASPEYQVPDDLVW